jgi:type II secretory pathway component PulF
LLIFAYEILSTDGIRGAGQLEASSLAGAAADLRQRGLRILRLAPSVEPAEPQRTWLLSERLQRRMPVGTKDLVFFSNISG